jgi:hypothetical protein
MVLIFLKLIDPCWVPGVTQVGYLVCKSSSFDFGIVLSLKAMDVEELFCERLALIGLISFVCEYGFAHVFSQPLPLR